MKGLKKILFLSVLCFVTTFVYSSELKDETLPATIRIIGDRYYPPYEMLNEKGVPEGFCVDLIREVMKRLGKPYTLRMVARNDIMNEVRAGRVDLVLEQTFTPERAQYLHFGTIYNYAFKGAFFRSDMSPITRFIQFKGKTVAAEKGSFAEKLLRSAPFPVRIIPIGDLTEGADLLAESRCDAVFCNYDIARYIVAQHKNFTAAELDLAPEKFCLSSTNETLLTKVDFIIYDLQRNGIYDKLLDKWIQRDNAAYYRNIIRVCMYSFVILAVAFLVFFVLLNYRVKRAKRQLLLNQQNLDLSIQAGDIGIWRYSIEERRFYNVFSDYFPPEGRPYDMEMMMFHPLDVDMFASSLRAAVEGNAPDKAILVRMDNTGRGCWRYIEIELHSMREGNGEVRGVIGTHKDVTDDIAQQNKIRELLNDHEIMFNNTSIGIQYFDAEGYLVKINNSACEIFGINDKQALIDARPNIFEYPELKGHISKANIHSEHFICRDDFDSVHENPAYGCRNKRGIHYIETFITPVYDTYQNLICIVVNNHDLTEREKLRQQVEEYAFRMKYILKSSGILTWTYNPDTHISSSIDEKEGKKDRLQGALLIDEVSENDKPKVRHLFEQMDNREIESFSIQVQFDRTYVDDSPSYYNIEGTPFVDKEGKIVYYLGLSINITHLIDIQNKLQHEMEEAKKADKLKSAILANVSHEIRTPLNSIVGFSDLLQYTEDEEEKKQYVEIIKTNNERLLAVVNDVLDLSRIESGSMSLFIESVDVETLFSQTFETFTMRLSDSPVEVVYSSPYSSCFIETDSHRLAQVLTNFMTNAEKYTREGHIRLGYECVDGGLKIFVEDTGQGIPTEKKDSVFDRFEKLDSFVQGAGLGLSICKDIAKMLQGKIGVESALGQGSTFWMWIPGEVKVTEKLKVEN
jgi:signal transduction histidine kinase/ABC-type amino acid transport substrate-binding protein/PAS domain-containing protein